MIDTIKEWCRRAYDRVAKSKLPLRDVLYQDIPEAARVSNRFSNQARFASCAMRRKGYMVQVDSSAFAALKPIVIDPKRRAAMEDAWLRGVLWTPLIVQARVTPRGWVLMEVKDYDIAHFLAERKLRISLQVIEDIDVPANVENLEELKNGLHNAKGEHCPVLSAIITL